MQMLKNAETVLRDPRMLSAFAIWSIGKFRHDPRLRYSDGAILGGFRHFSEYWSAANGSPTSCERTLSTRLLGRGGVAFDIGANIGQFALSLARIHQEVTVHAFEPVSSNYARLVANLERNCADNVVPQQLAVSHKSGFVHVTADEKSPATNKITENRDARIVYATTVDEYCEALSVKRVDFMKIDVEGAEPWVLQGASTLLSRHAISAILIEICPANWLPFKFNVEDITEPLAINGYGVWRVMPNGFPGERLTVDQLRAIELENVIAIPE